MKSLRATPALIERERQFLDSYQALIVSAWQDAAVRDRVLADPTTAAVEAGLPVDAGAVVRVDPTHADDLFLAEDVLRDWTATAGVHVLHLPDAPMVDLSELVELDVEVAAACWNIIFIY